MRTLAKALLIFVALHFMGTLFAAMKKEPHMISVVVECDDRYEVCDF